MSVVVVMWIAFSRFSRSRGGDPFPRRSNSGCGQQLDGNNPNRVKISFTTLPRPFLLAFYYVIGLQFAVAQIQAVDEEAQVGEGNRSPAFIGVFGRAVWRHDRKDILVEEGVVDGAVAVYT